jgi:hypothetical protein
VPQIEDLICKGQRRHAAFSQEQLEISGQGR